MLFREISCLQFKRLSLLLDSEVLWDLYSVLCIVCFYKPIKSVLKSMASNVDMSVSREDVKKFEQRIAAETKNLLMEYFTHLDKPNMLGELEVHFTEFLTRSMSLNGMYRSCVKKAWSDFLTCLSTS